MRLVARNRRGRQGDKIYIFEFESKNEADSFFSEIETYARTESEIPKDIREDVVRQIKTLKSRCDDKYGTEEHPYSASLFQGEAEKLLFAATLALAYKGISNGIRDGVTSGANHENAIED